MEINRTQRGFRILSFKDAYNIDCSLQESSLATTNAIWLGCDEAEPKVLINGRWENLSMPEEYVANTRMHLTQKQVKELLPYLIKFAETGTLSDD